MADNLTGVAILGSTGSVGTQALDVLAGLRHRFRVVGLAAGRNVELFDQQVRQWRPSLISCSEPADRSRIQSDAAEWASLEEIVTHPDVNVVLIATNGKAGLGPTLSALGSGKAVALANKEVLVMAGELIRAAVDAGSGSLRPVDSEHSAIWQCLWGELPEYVSRLILTASGGAFRDRTVEELAGVTPSEALHHPTWSMGRKITVDSATLLNKGMEMIEARWLFDIPLDRIDVLMHRESIVHSLVQFADGSVKAQLGVPDMRLPIQCSLTYPDRLPVQRSQTLDLGAIGTLHFAEPNFDRLPCLRLAIDAGKRGGTYPAVMAAADETAVEQFLGGRIGFMDIPRVIEATLNAHNGTASPDLPAILDADRWARDYALATSASSQWSGAALPATAS